MTPRERGHSLFKPRKKLCVFMNLRFNVAIHSPLRWTGPINQLHHDNDDYEEMAANWVTVGT
jgi:hypothetical protein